jgi:SAM-dependent methyltransferase
MFAKDRIVGLESQKSYVDKIESGFFAKYLSGQNILDVGFAGHEGTGQPIVPNAIGIDMNYPGYDGIRLPFADASQDAVYSSHCYEHIADHVAALRDWYRVLKVGGYIVLVVPHMHLFERRETLPSRWNADHKHFFTPARLLADIEEAFPPNTFRVRHLCDNDKGFDYGAMPQDIVGGCYEIELVLEKMPPLDWLPDNGNAQHWAPDRFNAAQGHATSGRKTVDFTAGHAAGCWLYGPYVELSKGHYRVQVFLEARGIDGQKIAHPITVDATRDYGQTVAAAVAITEDNQERIFSDGYAELFFYNPVHNGAHEFRVFLPEGKPFEGELRFYGADILMTRAR